MDIFYGRPLYSFIIYRKHCLVLRFAGEKAKSAVYQGKSRYLLNGKIETQLGGGGSNNCGDLNDNINGDNENLEWYIQLASQCYNEGFQWHMNYLNNCSIQSALQKRRVSRNCNRLSGLTKPLTRKTTADRSGSEKTYQKIYIKNYDDNFDEDVNCKIHVKLHEGNKHLSNSRKSQISYVTCSTQKPNIMNSSATVSGIGKEYQTIQRSKSDKITDIIDNFCTLTLSCGTVLPQIILTDFSSHDTTPVSTPLLLTPAASPQDPDYTTYSFAGSDSANCRYFEDQSNQRHYYQGDTRPV